MSEPECSHDHKMETHYVIFCRDCDKDLFYLEIGEGGNDYWEES